MFGMILLEMTITVGRQAVLSIEIFHNVNTAVNSQQYCFKV